MINLGWVNRMNTMKIKAFTLAEIMIVLTIIGVLAGILVPIATQNRPDENVMKFKKADATLAKVINQLVTSNKYYCNGDLGMKSDCTTLIETVKSSDGYFCKTIAELMSTKSVNCYTGGAIGEAPPVLLSGESLSNSSSLRETTTTSTVTDETIATVRAYMDRMCKSVTKSMHERIKAADGVVFYQAGVKGHGYFYNDLRQFSPPGQYPATHADQYGKDIVYKIFCIDVDDYDDTTGSDNCDDVNDICPFGYGIRADGKILPGARAEAWLGKDFQNKDE